MGDLGFLMDCTTRYSNTGFQIKSESFYLFEISNFSDTRKQNSRYLSTPDSFVPC